MSDYTELYALVENYLCAESSSPEVASHYYDLCKWFATHKRPDGREPLRIGDARPACPECGRTDDHTHPADL